MWPESICLMDGTPACKNYVAVTSHMYRIWIVRIVHINTSYFRNHLYLIGDANSKIDPNGQILCFWEYNCSCRFVVFENFNLLK